MLSFVTLKGSARDADVGAAMSRFGFEGVLKKEANNPGEPSPISDPDSDGDPKKFIPRGRAARTERKGGRKERKGKGKRKERKNERKEKKRKGRKEGQER